jgi:heptaprenyl diphosphate synthase
VARRQGRRKTRRPAPRPWLAEHTAPLHVFLTGVIVIVCFLFQQNLWVRMGQVGVFALLAVLAGKRIRWGYFLIMVGSITLFNLLTPVGEVLARVGPLVITRGALTQGLVKAFAIPGLVFISLFAVRPDLKLPGRFGGLVARLFFYFERVLEGRKKIRLRSFVASVDGVLMAALGEEGGSADADDTVRASARVQRLATSTDWMGYIVTGTLVVACAALVVVDRLP